MWCWPVAFGQHHASSQKGGAKPKGREDLVNPPAPFCVLSLMSGHFWHNGKIGSRMTRMPQINAGQPKKYP
jgi:hypothetical protein